MSTDPNLEIRTKFPVLQPRDILSPAATLLGFVLASFTYILGLAEDVSDISRFITFLIIAVFFLVIAAVLTIISNLTKYYVLWQAALVFYAGSWLFFGLIILIVLGNSLKLDPFTIQLPTLSNQLLVAIGSIGISILATYIAVRTSLQTTSELNSLIEKYENSSSDQDDIAEEVKKITNEQGQDMEMAFLSIYMDMEKSLRKFAEQRAIPAKYGKEHFTVWEIVKYSSHVGLLSNEFVNSFHILREMRNEIVHGMTKRKFRKKDLFNATTLAATMKIELNNIEEPDR